MKNIQEAGFIKEMIKATQDMWLKGWDERNGGNVSYRLEPREVQLLPNAGKGTDTCEKTNLATAVPELANEAFLVTGSGKYFRNVILDPTANLGILRIAADGKSYEKLWGFSNSAVPTSELAAHLLSHAVRLKASGGKDRVIIHTHSTNLIALTYRYELSEKAFTRALWEMSTECLVVFPDGVGVLPWMVPGTDEIGQATADLMRDHRLVLWPYHGVFGSGSTMDEAFGLIDTAEKAAEILVKVDSMGGRNHSLTDGNLIALSERFHVTPMAGILDAKKV